MQYLVLDKLFHFTVPRRRAAAAVKIRLQVRFQPFIDANSRAIVL